MASYLIVGAGKFGRLALERLGKEDEEAAFLVVDRNPQALQEARNLTAAPVAEMEAEAAAFLVQRLQNGAAWDWLIPAVPEHVAFSWLRQGPLAGTDWEPAEVPPNLAALTPVARRGREGELYLSRALHLCPDDCSEPQVCPVSGEPRETPLYEELAALSAPGYRIMVIPSRQLAPGVGGFHPGLLLALVRDLAGLEGTILVATACRCHGVVHGLKRRAGG
jgi:TrkA-N domain